MRQGLREKFDNHSGWRLDGNPGRAERECGRATPSYQWVFLTGDDCKRSASADGQFHSHLPQWQSRRHSARRRRVVEHDRQTAHPGALVCAERKTSLEGKGARIQPARLFTRQHAPGRNCRKSWRSALGYGEWKSEIPVSSENRSLLGRSISSGWPDFGDRCQLAHKDKPSRCGRNSTLEGKDWTLHKHAQGADQCDVGARNFARRKDAGSRQPSQRGGQYGGSIGHSDRFDSLQDGTRHECFYDSLTCILSGPPAPAHTTGRGRYGCGMSRRGNSNEPSPAPTWARYRCRGTAQLRFSPTEQCWPLLEKTRP